MKVHCRWGLSGRLNIFRIKLYEKSACTLWTSIMGSIGGHSALRPRSADICLDPLCDLMLLLHASEIYGCACIAQF